MNKPAQIVQTAKIFHQKLHRFFCKFFKLLFKIIQMIT